MTPFPTLPINGSKDEIVDQARRTARDLVTKYLRISAAADNGPVAMLQIAIASQLVAERQAVIDYDKIQVAGLVDGLKDYVAKLGKR